MIKSIDTLYRSRRLLLIGFCLIYGIWWFKLDNQSLDELVYSKEDHAQDMSKIYCDLAKISETRGDINAAINAYKKALEHNPNLHGIRELLALYKMK